MSGRPETAMGRECRIADTVCFCVSCPSDKLIIFCRAPKYTYTIAKLYFAVRSRSSLPDVFHSHRWQRMKENVDAIHLIDICFLAAYPLVNIWRVSRIQTVPEETIMMNKDNFILIQTKLKEHDEAATQDFLDSFREELVYELTELFIDRKKEELDKQLHSSKRMKKMLSGFADNNISYRIGIIMGILETMESLVHRQTVQNEVNIKISALFSKETNKKILLYLYDHPGSQHKVIAEALGIRPNYLSQQMRELEEAGGVVRYGVDRRSFYELTLDGQAFIEKNKGRKEHPVFTYDLVKQIGLDEKCIYGEMDFRAIPGKQKALLAGEAKTPYVCGKATFSRKRKEEATHAK